MRADAELAVATMPHGTFLRTAAILHLETAHLMAGGPDRADVLFEGAAEGRTGGTMLSPCVGPGRCQP